MSSAGVRKPRATTARPLRSPLVQERIKRAHVLVVSAILEEEEDTSAIAKPFYLVQELVPNLRWPEGGVVVYGHFPFFARPLVAAEWLVVFLLPQPGVFT